MQEPTLIDARNRLKQLGLIDFKGGRKNEASPVYELLYLNNLSRNRGKSIVNTEEHDEQSDEHIEETKLNVNKTKQKSGADAPPPAKTFKNFSEEDFIKEIQAFKDKYPYEILNSFFKYWKEKNTKGKMRFQLEKTWETELRLEKWKANQEKFDTSKTPANGTAHKQNTGTKPVPQIVNTGGFGTL